MPIHIDHNDPKYREAAAEILRRHDSGEVEANITTARRELRAWLRTSPEGAVGRLLGG